MNLRLASRIVLICLLLAAALLSIVGVLSYRSASRSLQAAAISGLLTAGVEKEAALTTWIDQGLVDLEQLSTDVDLLERVTALVDAVPGTKAARAAHALVLQELAPHMTGHMTGYLELFVIDADSGTVVASTVTSHEGRTKRGHAYFEHGKSGSYIQTPYSSLDLKGPAMTASVPLRLANGRLVAVLAAYLDFKALNAIAQRRTEVRKTEEAFLINADRVLVTQPRFLSSPAILIRTINSNAARRCVTGKSGVILEPNYHGAPAIKVYRWIARQKLCLIVAVDQAEALAPARAFGRWVLLISALALLGTAGLASLLASTITRPLRFLHKNVADFAEGDGRVTGPAAGGDEVAMLGQAFTQMQARVRQRTAELANSNTALLTENAERRRTEEVLRESEDKFRQLADNIGDAFWVSSLDLQTMHYLSPAFESLLGIPVERFYANPLLWIDGVVPEDRDRVVAVFARLAHEPTAAAEYRITRPDGAVRWIYERGFQVRDAEGNPYRTAGITTDITDRKAAEDQLRESEEKFRQLAENIDDVFWMTSLDMRVMHYVSPAFARIWGRSVQSLFANPATWLEAIVPEDREHVKATFGKLADEPSVAVEYRIARPDGTVRWIHDRGFQVRDGAGNPYRTAGVASDITERKHAELALQASEARTSAIVQSALDCIVTIDHQGMIQEFNPAAETVFGHARANVIGRELSEVIIPPALRTAHRHGLQRYISSGKAHILGKRIEMTAIRSDGSEFPVELTISRMGTDWPPTFTGFIRDLSERKAAEAQLERLRVEHGLILNSVVEGVHWVDTDGRIKFENPAAARQLGYAVSELLGLPAHATIHHSHADGTPYPVGECSIYATLADGVTRRTEDEVFWRKDGSSFPVEYTCTAVLDEAGNAVGSVVVFSDITERKKAEQQLSIQYAVNRVLAESTTAEEATPKLLQLVCETVGWDLGAVWKVDHRDRVIRCDETWSRPGQDFDEFKRVTVQGVRAIGVGLPGRVWATGRPAWIANVNQDRNFQRGAEALASGLHSGFAFPILIGSQVSGVLEFYSRETRDPDDQLLRTFTILGSQLGQFVQSRHLEGQLLQSQRLETVGKLAGGVAHEFNSILTAIIGQSDMLLTDLASNDPLVKNATEIRNAADRAASLTRQLLAYGRKQMLRPVILDLNQIVADSESVMLHLMGGDVDVRIIPGPGLKAVRADSGQLEQVLMNLAINAREAMPQGGKLTLETSNVTVADSGNGNGSAELKSGDYVMLSVTDTGKGMSPEVRARLFEPFFTTKSAGEGAGLGLATSYGIIKQSGGHITVYSELGRGTSVKVYLPQVERSPTPSTQLPKTPGLPRGTETILLVEDDPALREMAAMLLQRLGYEVLAAAGGNDALRIVEQRGDDPIQLLFTDMVMPQLDGKELADRVVAMYPHTKVLFTSAYTENSMIHQGVLSASVALLQKPFTPSALAVKVREVLDRVVEPALS